MDIELQISELKNQISNLENRQKQFEENNKQEEILTILNKITVKLVGGSLESGNQANIVDDLKELKKDADNNREKLALIDTNIQEIRRVQGINTNFEQKFAELDKTVTKLKTWGLIGYGALLVLGWMISHAGELFTLITTIKK